jgi:hypothetical protein
MEALRMQFRLSHFFWLVAAFAALLAVPKIKMALPEYVALPTILAHQVCCASLFGTILWHMLGKRKVVGRSIGLVINMVWLPFGVDIAQHLIWGDPTIIYHATEGLGTTDEFRRLWYSMCHAIDYQLEIVR